MPKVVKETKQDFYYKFPSAKWFVLRKLDGKWTHYYPRKDGDLPTSYSTKSAADKNVVRTQAIFGVQDVKVVSGTQASKYPVPKRF